PLVSVASDAQRTPNLGSIYVRLADIQQRHPSQQRLMGEVRDRVLSQFAKAGSAGSQSLRLSVQPVATFGSGRDAAIQYVMSGPDIGELSASSQQALEKLKAIRGVVDADTSLVVGKPELSVVI